MYLSGWNMDFLNTSTKNSCISFGLKPEARVASPDVDVRGTAGFDSLPSDFDAHSGEKKYEITVTSLNVVRLPPPLPDWSQILFLIKGPTEFYHFLPIDSSYKPSVSAAGQWWMLQLLSRSVVLTVNLHLCQKGALPWWRPLLCPCSTLFLFFSHCGDFSPVDQQLNLRFNQTDQMQVSVCRQLRKWLFIAAACQFVGFCATQRNDGKVQE